MATVLDFGVAPAWAQVWEAGSLPRDLSPWSMFVHADLVVQAVMIGLAFASLVTWSVWLAKTIELRAARRSLLAGLTAVTHERSLADAASRIEAGPGVLPALIRAAAEELNLSADLAKEGIKERIASRFARIEAGGRPAT